ncbi:MAG TPA: hypothetical protein VE091_10015 [Gemmatimonadales bacterium]|nr:hypothetical protein [Gemmatimonadales bacterium]
MGWSAQDELGALLRQARLVLALGTVAPFLPAVLPAQSVSPPIVEYQERARSSFQLSNGSIFPLTVVLEVHGFDVTEAGEVVASPLDTAHVHVKLSATSFRLAPRATYTVFYEARADSLPTWFSVTAAMSGARTDNGLNLRLILPHVVYLNQKQPLRKSEVVVRRLEVNSAARTARVQLENLSPHLGRVLELQLATAKGQSRSAGAFPLLPGHRRWVHVDWDLDQPPEHVTLRFVKFAIDTALTPVPTAGETAEGTQSTNGSPSGTSAASPLAAERR